MLCATLILCSVSPIADGGRNDANYDGGAGGSGQYNDAQFRT